MNQDFTVNATGTGIAKLDSATTHYVSVDANSSLSTVVGANVTLDASVDVIIQANEELKLQYEVGTPGTDNFYLQRGVNTLLTCNAGAWRTFLVFSVVNIETSNPFSFIFCHNNHPPPK